MPVTNQANIEYFFRLLYECFHGACYGHASGTIDASAFSAWLAHLWLWIIVVGYLLAVIAFIMIIYCTVRIFELRRREEEYYGTLILAPEDAASNPRWTHIQTLIKSTNPSDWRTAIVEADIMLDDMLTKQGYKGANMGEKLKQVERADFNTVQDAWEAHKVRNQIAHEGSAFDLSNTLALRTIAHYEAVFREFEML